MMDAEKTLLQELLRQEETLQFSKFSNATALDLGLGIVHAAQRAGQAVMVDIRCGDLQLFQHAMEGTTPDNTDWVRRKVNVVRRFAHSSFYMGTLYRSKGTDFDTATGLDPREYAAHGGAFPIYVRGAGIIGTVTVSGLPQADDHALAVAVLQTML
ncbi:heme-degrading domain-containing protein [Rhodoferax sp.]|uniref:heme-degrading domain-containing protein n=1 Tax=Rhodoferax sp. TaxID=50421 RepID=UPI00374D7568